MVRLSYIFAPGRICDRIQHGAAVGNVESRLGRLGDDEATVCGSKVRIYGTDDDVKNVHGVCSHRDEAHERDQVRVPRECLVCERTLRRREPRAASDALDSSFSVFHSFILGAGREKGWRLHAP